MEYIVLEETISPYHTPEANAINLTKPQQLQNKPEETKML
jgi:hypothetical protein